MVKCKTLDDIAVFIESELREISNNARVIVIDCECDTDRGTQSWEEYEIDNLPEYVTLEFQHYFHGNEVEVLKTIVTTIREFKFYVEKSPLCITTDLDQIKFLQPDTIEVTISFDYDYC